jgi:hypothetical protein
MRSWQENCCPEPILGGSPAPYAGPARGIDEFIARGLESDAKLRIPTVKEFLAALDKLAFTNKAVFVSDRAN